VRKLKTSELNRLSPDEFKASDKIPFIIVLDNVRSQHNVGSIFRIADAFRLEGIHLCGITAVPPNREMHKTALGATESVSWKFFPETINSIRSLKKEGYKIYAVEQTDESIPLDKIQMQSLKKIALVFGNEIHGIDEKVIGESDGSIEIPQFGTKHSLNVSVTAGIVIWELGKNYFKSVKN
jgi:23S rRNA (guanosine2251-2'-O)-methyltransferase